VLRESWTLYPTGHPMTSALRSRGIRLADGAQAILFGTGLGLSIAGSLAQGMDGRIDATSRVGQGSCCRFVVPVGLPAAP
jgi:signal transduction histidine kinase